ncbi:DUF397 domain-containing protein [Streptomyces thermoalcalitolerans]|uniref:DUF397 domain-containing protein n=1 Tax=Streptomyces thermoalcalitolerans TaxID=65605 RepID=UPI0031D08530
MNIPESAHLTWFKSSYSGNEGGACLEVAAAPGAVHVRDSKDPARGRLSFRRREWDAFVRFASGR